jgi:hypothetical protein
VLTCGSQSWICTPQTSKETEIHFQTAMVTSHRSFHPSCSSSLSHMIGHFNQERGEDLLLFGGYIVG